MLDKAGTHENPHDTLHAELMDAIHACLSEPEDQTLATALVSALGGMLVRYQRQEIDGALLRAFTHELALEIARYHGDTHAGAFGRRLAAIVEARLSPPAIAA